MTRRAPRTPALEGFALETHDGLIFTVKGVVQPPQRTVAYLRYVPDPRGSRQRAGVRYRRVYAFADQLATLADRGRDYVTEDPAFGVRLQAVPHGDVHLVYDPRRRLDELRVAGPGGALEEAALEFCELVRRRSGAPEGSLGLTGSLLFGLHDAASDIDVVVYGGAASRAVSAALAALMRDASSGVRLPDAVELAAIGAKHREDTPLPAAEFARLQARKVNEGHYAGRSFFVRFVRLPEEVLERYGDPRYEPLGRATIRARVVDDADALFTPCAYRLADVVVESGPAPPELREVASFRGRFSDQARAGEWIVATGTVERVVPAHGPATARLTVGGTPGDYLLSRPA